MSAERDELRRLVEELADDRVPVVLAEARRQSSQLAAGEWPPPWFGSFASGRSDLGSNHEDLLAEGFGRSWVIVCDTGPLVAAADRDDQHNRTCTDLLTGLHLARRAILVPAPVVAEVGYLLARARAAKVAAAFLRSIVQATLTVVDLELVDYERMAELVEIYADFPLGTTDAAVVAVAERLGVVEIATLDRLSAAHGGALAGHVGQVDGEGPGAVSGVGRQLRATCPKLLARVAAGAASVDAAAVGSSCSTSSRRTYAPLGSNLVLRATTSRPRPVFSLLSGSTIDK